MSVVVLSLLVGIQPALAQLRVQELDSAMQKQIDDAVGAIAPNIIVTKDTKAYCWPYYDAARYSQNVYRYCLSKYGAVYDEAMRANAPLSRRERADVVRQRQEEIWAQQEAQQQERAAKQQADRQRSEQESKEKADAKAKADEKLAEQLRTGKVKPANSQQAIITYGAADGTGIIIAPKLRPDGQMYVVQGVIVEADEKPEFKARGSLGPNEATVGVVSENGK